MTIQEATAVKVQRLPENLAQEVSDFIDFLVLKHDESRREYFSYLTEGMALAEAGMGDYLRNLEDYEARLERGEIKWQE